MINRIRMQAIWKDFYLTPARALIISALAIFIAEFAVMLVFFFLPVIFSPATTPLGRSILDATFLIVLLVPFLYLFVYRPLLLLVRERAAAEEALLDEIAREERYLDIAGVMIVALDPEGRVTLINRKGCELLGRDEEDVLGRNWFDAFLPERARGEARSVFAHLMAGEAGAADYHETPISCALGGERLIRWHNKLLMDGGVKTGTLSSGEDVTERKEVLNALRESEARYRLVHNAAFDAIIISDADDIVIECNPSAEALFGYASGALVGAPLVNLMPEKHRARHAAALRHFLETRVSTVQGKVLELEGLRANGEVFPVELILSNFTLGNRIYFTGTIRDVTERKRAERERTAMQTRLAQSQKMEAIGRLAGGIAHDFNNVLTAIRGNAELAMEDVTGAAPARERLNDIIQSILTASKLTRQLLLFSRGQSREAASLNVNDTIENLLRLIRRLIGDDIAIVTEFEKAIWMIKAEEGTIEQVVMNLAVNARDAMPAGGVLTIKTENAIMGEAGAPHMPDAPLGRAVCITVTDTGVGMEKELIERIFEPFFSTKEASRGTGLGLSVVYGIIKKQGGGIMVESAPGAGTTFRICLPARLPEEEGGVKEETAQPGFGSGEGVLLVDGDDRVRQMGRTALSERGYKVFEAVTAEEAASVFEKESANIQLLLCDALLAGASVLRLVDYMLSKNPKLQILLTGTFMEIKSRRLAMSETGFRYLQKPYSLNGLFRAVAVSMEHGEHAKDAKVKPAQVEE
ncbi:MAG: PAS domain S-box protein [Deltaproteobacteria bacterium]|nr:PAS domain S-box protein [Deltaproteobacteria bacterium]